MAELRIMITVPLPDDTWQRAEALTNIRPYLDGLKDDWNKFSPSIQHEISDAKTPKPRKQRADAGKARKATPVIREAAE